MKDAPVPLPDLEPLAGKQTGREVTKLVGLMQRLLAPDGCPWDREQTLASLRPFVLEETYEVLSQIAPTVAQPPASSVIGSVRLAVHAPGGPFRSSPRPPVRARNAPPAQRRWSPGHSLVGTVGIPLSRRR